MTVLSDASEREAWIVLATATGVGPATFASLVRRFGTAASVLDAARLPGALGLRRPPADPQPRGRDPLRIPAVVEAIVAAAQRSGDVLASVKELGLTVVTLADPAYPSRLRSIDIAPPVLFIRGDPAGLELGHAVAVVGTRRPSLDGRRLAARIGGEIARSGAAVISGLAVGVDGAAHEAALAEHGITIGVLGSGHRTATPWAHRHLMDRIVDAGGAVVSEFAPEVRPTRATFPIRNRTISGLAEATVIVEAPPGSGALITGKWALTQGRDCFVVPGPIGRETSAGSLDFLRTNMGLAHIVAGIPELLVDLGLGGVDYPSHPAVGDDLGAVESTIAAAIANGIASVDELVAATRLAPATVLAAITRLEVRGLVVEVFGRYLPHGPLATKGAVTSHRGGSRGFARSPKAVLG